jgi:hypothetical protein
MIVFLVKYSLDHGLSLFLLLLFEVDFVDTLGTAEVSAVTADIREIIGPIACDGD